MTRTIFFDMDGTIANLYGVEGWLADIINSNERPYTSARSTFTVRSQKSERRGQDGWA